jgi:hypothetical protein
VDSDLLHRACEAGQFILLLDGYDEVDLDRRPSVLQGVLQLQSQYPRLDIVVSSRPDTALQGWPDFDLWTLKPLDLAQAISLIDKLPVELATKSAFIDDLERKLYQQHYSFASNPLLLSIMYLTYGQSLSIPNKLNVFYYQAYAALFERHDALKGGAFKRQRRTSLDIQDFARVFAAFCLQAYDARVFEFTKVDALKYIGTASRLVQIKCDPGDYLHDVKEAVGCNLCSALV